MEGVSIDLHIASNGHVSWGNERLTLVNVLVLALVQELALNDTRVLLGGLVDANVVISQVEGDDESTVNVQGCPARHRTHYREERLEQRARVAARTAPGREGTRSRNCFCSTAGSWDPHR